jgi:transcriptional regulator
MYIPDAFRIEDEAQILRIMTENSFATLITTGASGLTATHLPLLVESAKPLILAGHMARANPQWKDLEAAETLAIFHGPHTFVSPSWYKTSPNVPTWNYVSAHAYCRAEIVSDPDQILRHLNESVDYFDPELRSTNPESIDEAYLRKMALAVVAFRLHVGRVDAKAKLNQNKKEVDRLAVRERLGASGDAEHARMANLMPEDLLRGQ